MNQAEKDAMVAHYWINPNNGYEYFQTYMNGEVGYKTINGK